MTTQETSSNKNKKISKSSNLKNNHSKDNKLSKHTPLTDWVKLDNAALIYPSSANDKWNFVFRIQAIIDEEINPILLQNALETILPRFPHFNVCLRKGFFWYYFQALHFAPKVIPETNFPCKMMDFSPHKHLFRVLYYKNKISLEMFHSLTDGFGASVFLTNLLSAYYTLSGKNISLKDYVIDYRDKPTLNDLEDPFAKVADAKVTRSRKEVRRRRLFGTPLEHGKLKVITGELSLKEIKQVSKAMGFTITELLTAILFKSIVESENPFLYKKLPLKISIPINARSYFSTQTTRNFSSYINVSLLQDQEQLSLEEIATLVKEQFKQINKEFVLGNINHNVKDQKNFFVRIMPLPIKNIALNLSYRMMGEGLQSTVFSNLGLLALPEDLNPHIQRIDTIIGSNKYNPLVLCGSTVNDAVSLTFSSTIVETNIQQNFFKQLSSLGIKIKIYTNMID